MPNRPIAAQPVQVLPGIYLQSPAGRWTLAGAVLSSGAVFLESTVVNVALPVLGRDLGLGLEGLQWVLNSYLLTLSALMLLGGSLGDLLGHRRMLCIGLTGFTITSLTAAFAPSAVVLIGVRIVQGVAGAMLVPNTLALINSRFAPGDRAQAIGRWAGWSAVSTALGPLVGGALVDALSWRWVFGVPAPFALAALGIIARRVAPDPGVRRPHRQVDTVGAGLVTLGLAGVIWALIAAPARGLGDPVVAVLGSSGLALLAAFLAYERRARDPMLPLSLFAAPQFTGANAVTLLVYAALGGMMFLLPLQLQNGLGYSALQAGAAMLPINVLMLTLSGRAGRLAQRRGPAMPLGVGALLCAVGMGLLARIQPGMSYLGGVLPGILVFGLGLALLVAPLTAAVLGAVREEQGGIASAVNNAAARVAGLFAVAALPLAAGIGRASAAPGAALGPGYARAMGIAAALCVAGAAVAVATARRASPRAPTVHPNLFYGCVEPPAADSGARA
ncbi:MAG TPA: MFS transporter [Gemmatimonadales bacterium]|nr:MFS transporter [Gemmatimonadales bacterium]